MGSLATIHPPFSGFPGVILVLLLGLELIFLAKLIEVEKAKSIATFLVIALCIISPFTYFSGYFGSEYASRSFEVSQDVIKQHQFYALLFLFSLFPLSIMFYLRLIKAEYAFYYRFFLLVSLALVLITANMGGVLVFEHGAGVQLITK